MKFEITRAEAAADFNVLQRFQTEKNWLELAPGKSIDNWSLSLKIAFEIFEEHWNLQQPQRG